MSDKSFSQRLKNGETREQLQNHYVLSDRASKQIVSCLQEIKKNGENNVHERRV